MPVFPSDAWIDEYCRRLAARPDAGEVASALDGVYRFVVEPAAALERTYRSDVEIRTDDAAGSLVVRRLDDPAPAPTLTIAADYGRWRQLITGQLDIGSALLLRRVRVSGELSRLLSQVSSAEPLLSCLQEVDTQWQH